MLKTIQIYMIYAKTRILSERLMLFCPFTHKSTQMGRSMRETTERN